MLITDPREHPLRCEFEWPLEPLSDVRLRGFLASALPTPNFKVLLCKTAVAFPPLRAGSYQDILYTQCADSRAKAKNQKPVGLFSPNCKCTENEVWGR